MRAPRAGLSAGRGRSRSRAVHPRSHRRAGPSDGSEFGIGRHVRHVGNVSRRCARHGSAVLKLHRQPHPLQQGQVGTEGDHAESRSGASSVRCEVRRAEVLGRIPRIPCTPQSRSSQRGGFNEAVRITVTNLYQTSSRRVVGGGRILPAGGHERLARSGHDDEPAIAATDRSLSNT
jgi:hypothetical protein